jgi:hypothetical protein
MIVKYPTLNPVRDDSGGVLQAMEVDIACSLFYGIEIEKSLRGVRSSLAESALNNCVAIRCTVQYIRRTDIRQR